MSAPLPLDADITISGTRLSDTEALVVRVALAALVDTLANKMGFKDDGIPITDQYQTDAANVLALIEGRAPHV